MDAEEQIDSKFMQKLRDSFVARVPKGRKFMDLSPTDDIQKDFETIAKAWCFNYRVPTGLLNLDKPSQVQTQTITSTGKVISMCLKPMLEPVFEILAYRNKGKVELDYSPMEQGSILDAADSIMKLSQTGVLTINEIREQQGYCLLYTSPSPRDS